MKIGFPAIVLAAAMVVSSSAVAAVQSCGVPAVPAAPAGSIGFAGCGFVAPTGPPGPSGLPVAILPGATYTLGSQTGWTLLAPFNFDFGTGTGTGTFTFSRASDSLFGTFSTVAAPGGFSLTYLLSGGTGQYAGVAGSGTSSVLLQGDPNSPPTPFTETGILSFRVPEPATAGLLVLALGGVAIARRRRAPAA